MPLELMTLLDLKNSVQPVDGGIIDVAETLVQENEALADIPWAAGNQLTGDVHYKRAVMPTAHIRKINQGIKSSISKKEAEVDACIQIVSRSAVDMGELDIAPDAAKYLALESRPHIAVMGEDVVRTIFLGAPADGILGFGNRYGKITGAPPEKARQIINFGGAGNRLASVYIVKWDGNEVTGIYPKNTTAGLRIDVLTDQLIQDKNGDTFRAHITEFSQYFGLKVRDPRFVVRLCNIAMDDLETDEAARLKLFEDLIRAKNRIYHVSQGRVVMYLSPDLYTMMEIAAFQKTNTVVGYKEGIQSDTRLLTFSGVPIRRNDFQAEPESLVA